MVSTTYLERKIDRDTEARVGNGFLKPEPTPWLIQPLVEVGMRVSDIALACIVTEARVLAETTGYQCKSCGRVAELHKGFLEWFCTGGDESQEFMATDCCSALFVDQYGNEYLGDNRPEAW